MRYTIEETRAERLTWELTVSPDCVWDEETIEMEFMKALDVKSYDPDDISDFTVPGLGSIEFIDSSDESEILEDTFERSDNSPVATEGAMEKGGSNEHRRTCSECYKRRLCWYVQDIPVCKPCLNTKVSEIIDRATAEKGGEQ